MDLMDWIWMAQSLSMSLIVGGQQSNAAGGKGHGHHMLSVNFDIQF